MKINNKDSQNNSQNPQNYNNYNQWTKEKNSQSQLENILNNNIDIMYQNLQDATVVFRGYLILFNEVLEKKKD